VQLAAKTAAAAARLVLVIALRGDSSSAHEHAASLLSKEASKAARAPTCCCTDCIPVLQASCLQLPQAQLLCHVDFTSEEILVLKHVCLRMQLHFTPDAQEKDLEIFHRLKLYADDDPTGQSRKPVVHVSIAFVTHKIVGCCSLLLIECCNSKVLPLLQPPASFPCECAAGLSLTLNRSVFKVADGCLVSFGACRSNGRRLCLSTRSRLSTSV
jgi:hypothetical protein